MRKRKKLLILHHHRPQRRRRSPMASSILSLLFQALKMLLCWHTLTTNHHQLSWWQSNHVMIKSTEAIMFLMATNCLAPSPSSFTSTSTSTIHSTHTMPPLPPSYNCQCSWKSGKFVADCSNQNLNQVPKNDHYDSLLTNAGNNQMSTLTRDIQQLNLASNNISILNEREFFRKKFRNLQKLYLNSNKLVKLHSSVFYKLTGLIELDLSDNLLTSLSGSGSVSNTGCAQTMKHFPSIVSDELNHVRSSSSSGVVVVEDEEEISGFVNNNNNNNNKDEQVRTSMTTTSEEQEEQEEKQVTKTPSLQAMKTTPLKGEKTFSSARKSTAAFRCHKFTSFLQDLIQLRQLNLASNELTRIEEFTFSPLLQLRQLYLSRNKISFIDKRAFNGLTQLNVLHLDENKLSYLDGEILLKLPKLHTLQLAGNEWRCECRLRKLVRLLRAHSPIEGAPIAQSTTEPAYQLSSSVLLPLLNAQLNQNIPRIGSSDLAMINTTNSMQLANSLQDEPQCSASGGGSITTTTNGEGASEPLTGGGLSSRRSWRSTKLSHFECAPEPAKRFMPPATNLSPSSLQATTEAASLSLLPLPLPALAPSIHPSSTESDNKQQSSSSMEGIRRQRQLLLLKRRHFFLHEPARTQVELTSAFALTDELDLNFVQLEWWWKRAASTTAATSTMQRTSTVHNTSNQRAANERRTAEEEQQQLEKQQHLDSAGGWTLVWSSSGSSGASASSNASQTSSSSSSKSSSRLNGSGEQPKVAAGGSQKARKSASAAARADNFQLRLPLEQMSTRTKEPDDEEETKKEPEEGEAFGSFNYAIVDYVTRASGRSRSKSGSKSRRAAFAAPSETERGSQQMKQAEEEEEQEETRLIRVVHLIMDQMPSSSTSAAFASALESERDEDEISEGKQRDEGDEAEEEAQARRLQQQQQAAANRSSKTLFFLCRVTNQLGQQLDIVHPIVLVAAAAESPPIPSSAPNASNRNNKQPSIASTRKNHQERDEIESKLNEALGSLMWENEMSGFSGGSGSSSRKETAAAGSLLEFAKFFIASELSAADELESVETALNEVDGDDDDKVGKTLLMKQTKTKEKKDPTEENNNNNDDSTKILFIPIHLVGLKRHRQQSATSKSSSLLASGTSFSAAAATSDLLRQRPATRQTNGTTPTTATKTASAATGNQHHTPSMSSLQAASISGDSSSSGRRSSLYSLALNLISRCTSGASSPAAFGTDYGLSSGNGFRAADEWAEEAATSSSSPASKHVKHAWARNKSHSASSASFRDTFAGDEEETSTGDGDTASDSWDSEVLSSSSSVWATLMQQQQQKSSTSKPLSRRISLAWRLFYVRHLAPLYHHWLTFIGGGNSGSAQQRQPLLLVGICAGLLVGCLLTMLLVVLHQLGSCSSSSWPLAGGRRVHDLWPSAAAAAADDERAAASEESIEDESTKKRMLEEKSVSLGGVGAGLFAAGEIIIRENEKKLLDAGEKFYNGNQEQAEYLTDIGAFESSSNNNSPASALMVAPSIGCEHIETPLVDGDFYVTSTILNNNNNNNSSSGYNTTSSCSQNTYTNNQASSSHRLLTASKPHLQAPLQQSSFATLNSRHQHQQLSLAAAAANQTSLTTTTTISNNSTPASCSGSFAATLGSSGAGAADYSHQHPYYSLHPYLVQHHHQHEHQQQQYEQAGELILVAPRQVEFLAQGVADIDLRSEEKMNHEEAGDEQVFELANNITGGSLMGSAQQASTYYSTSSKNYRPQSGRSRCRGQEEGGQEKQSAADLMQRIPIYAHAHQQVPPTVHTFEPYFEHNNNNNNYLLQELVVQGVSLGGDVGKASSRHTQQPTTSFTSANSSAANTYNPAATTFFATASSSNNNTTNNTKSRVKFATRLDDDEMNENKRKILSPAQDLTTGATLARRNISFLSPSSSSSSPYAATNTTAASAAAAGVDVGGLLSDSDGSILLAAADGSIRKQIDFNSNNNNNVFLQNHVENKANENLFHLDEALHLLHSSVQDCLQHHDEYKQTDI